MFKQSNLLTAFALSTALLSVGTLGGCTIDQANAAPTSGVTLKEAANDTAVTPIVDAAAPIRTVETALEEKVSSDNLPQEAGTKLLGQEKIGEDNFYFVAVVTDAASKHGVLKPDGSVEALPCRTTVIEASKAFEITASGKIVVDVTKGTGTDSVYARDISGVKKSEARFDCVAPA
jgi:hypothetical protein